MRNALQKGLSHFDILTLLIPTRLVVIRSIRTMSTKLNTSIIQQEHRDLIKSAETSGKLGYVRSKHIND